MADKWQMSNGFMPNGFYRPTAAARSQLDLGARAHQTDQFQAHPLAQSQATGSSLHNIRPVDNLNNTFSRVIESINRLSIQQQHYFDESLAKTDKRLEEYLSYVLSLRETADGLTKKLDTFDGIKEALERSNRCEDKREKEIKVLVGEMKAFKKTLGKSCDGDDGRTVLGRLDAVTFAVGELLERARDPEANLPEQPCIIDLTRSTSPPVGPTSPVHSRTYAEVGTSPVSSPLPLKEDFLASIRASPQCGLDSFESFAPYPGRSSSAHTFVNDTTTTSPDTVSSAPTQDNLELAYPPIPMDEDTVDTTEPTIDSQTTSTVIISNSEAISQTQKNTALSNASVTTTKTPHFETTASDVDLSMPSDLASPKDAQNSPNITTLDDKNKPADIHDAGLLNETLGPGPGIQTFKQPASTASASSASPAITLTPSTQTEVQPSADKTIASLTTSARVNPYPGNHNSSVSEGKKQQIEQSQKQGLPERLESPLSTSTCDGGTPSLDNINSEKLNEGADGKGYNEVTRKAMKGAEEIKVTEERTSIELGGNRIGDVPAQTPGRIDFSQLLQRRRSSSSRVASPSTSLSSLSIKGRGRTGSRLSVSSPEDVTYSSSLPFDAKFSSTKTKILAGAGVSCSSAAQPPTTPAAASPSASVSTRTAVTAPIQKAASVSSQSAFRPTTTNAELVVSIIPPATPASIFKSPVISPTKSTTPAAFEFTHPESATAMTNNPLPLSPPSTLPAATSTPAVLTISPTTPAISPRLGSLASPAAIFNELPPPSQASNISQDEVLVSRMVIEKENGNNEGEVGNLTEKTTGKIELKMTSRDKEEKEEEEEEEKQPDRLLSRSLSPLSPLSPSVSGSPYHLPVKASGPSTPGPRCTLFLTPLPRSPLASASSKNQTQRPIRSPSTTPFVAVVSSSCSPKPIDLDLNIEHQSPLFSSPTNSISAEQHKEEEEEGSVSHKLKSPEDNDDGTTNPAIPAQAPALNEILLPRDLSSISEVEKGKRTIEGTVKMQVKKVFTSLGDNADIVRVKKRKVSEGSSRINRESSYNTFGQNPLRNPFAKGKGKERSSMTDLEPLTRNPLGLNPSAKRKGKEIDDLEVETKSGEAVKKRSLLNLKVGKKGDSLAVTRVRKRKARPDSVVDGEADGVGQHDDGLDEERPLKRARQRVSDSQMKTEPAEKGKQVSRGSESSFGAGTLTTAMKPGSSVSVKKGPPSKARLSVNRGQGKAEVKWPTIAEEYKDLVECDKCKAWYHYGCVGLSAGDKRLRGGGKFFCPPCEAGTTIKRLNLYADCWRPGCTIWTGYIVENIIGRFKKFVGGKKYQFKYLLQWKGYKLSESSWEPEESMFDPSFMIEKFRVDALKEGIDIDKEETGVILLQVAKDPSVPQPT